MPAVPPARPKTTARRGRARGSRPARRSRPGRRGGAPPHGLAAALADVPQAFAWLGEGGIAWANHAFARLAGAAGPDAASGALEAAFPGVLGYLARTAAGLLPGGEATLRLDGARPAIEVALSRPAGRVDGVLVLARGVDGQAEANERAARARAERVAERLARLQEVTAALSAAATEREVADATFQLGLGVVHASGGSISFPAEDGRLHVAHAFGSLARRGGSPLPPPEPIRASLDDAYGRAEPVWIPSAEAFARLYPGSVPEGRLVTDTAWAAVPLRVPGRALGVLGIGFAGQRAFDEEERGFLVAVAQQCAQALERARLYESQQALAARAARAADERHELVRELRRTLRERDESMALLDALFENLPLGLALLDLDMRYVRVNAHMARLNGAPPDAHVGRQIWDVLPRMVRDELVEDFRTVLRTRKPSPDRSISAQLRSPGEPVLSYVVGWYPVLSHDRLVAVGVLVREVTEQRRAEQLQRHLLGVVGHDLRSPLMAITASAELMQTAPLGERERRSLGRILRAAQRIDGIIRALVDYTLVQVGSGIPLQRRRADLGAIVRTVAEEAETVHAGRRVRVSHDEPVQGEWDPDRVGQALANLVGNAIDYSLPESAVEVRCRGEASEGIVEVSNEGPPIAEDLVPHLFEPFRRGADAHTQRRKGLGLGLYIARQIVAAHGGTIEVDTGAGRPTTFRVRLPRAGQLPAAPGDIIRP